MARSNQREIPAELERGRDRFAAWRRTRRPKTRIPESLWELAVRLAATHGLNCTARALKLDYYSLKKRVEAGAHHEQNASAFLELPPVPASVQECVIECEDGAVRLRVHLKGYSAAEIATVGRSFRDAS
jgi:hypothetical protein